MKSFYGGPVKKKEVETIKKKYKLQITNKVAHELHELTRITGRDYNTTKGSHGLHQGSFKLQTMTALMKSFCRGVQGGQFFQKAPPWPPEARKGVNHEIHI